MVHIPSFTVPVMIPEPIMFGTGVVLEAMSQVTVEADGLVSYHSYYTHDTAGNEAKNYFTKPVTDKKGEIITVDRPSFGALAPSFFADKDMVYGMRFDFKKREIFFTPIKGVKRESFQSIGLYYATDGIHSYYAPTGKVIKNEVVRIMNDDHIGYDLFDEQLRVVERHNFWQSHIALGQSHVYFRGTQIVISDANTFKKIEAKQAEIYADNQVVYYIDKGSANNPLLPLLGIDRQSFICVDEGKKPGTHRSIQYCGDKNGPLWWHAHKLSKRKDLPNLEDVAAMHKDFFESQKDNPVYKDFWYWKYR